MRRRIHSLVFAGMFAGGPLAGCAVEQPLQSPPQNLPIVQVLPSLDGADAAAYAQVRKAEYFAIGGVGYAGSTSLGEKALRRLLKRKDAARLAESLIRESGPPGKLYGLLALKLLRVPGFAASAQGLSRSGGETETMRGCLIDHETIPAIVAEIQSGKAEMAWGFSRG